MISISKTQISRSFLFAFAACILLPFAALAQGSQTLSVTPTLFEMAAHPTQSWQSAVKVSNPNQYDLTIYATVVNFAPRGEGGAGQFLPVFEDVTDGTTLAEWISINTEPIVIPREQSVQIPFTVDVPESAAPGGHFAAIMVGTKPAKSSTGLAVNTSQMVTSLFFVRIAGDVVESGTIRSFLTTEQFVGNPAVDFELRFENKGNVHLQPQGDISIYNMWGEERGYIPINHQTHFGNVLPQSIRNFRFNWEGEQSITDIGRFRAVATLGYGQDTQSFTTRELYFYVIPVKEMLITLGTLIVIMLFASWAIKAYVRRMLILSGIDPDAPRQPRAGVRTYDPNAVKLRSYQQISAPVRSGVSDLRTRLAAKSEFGGKLRAFVRFVAAYKLFFASATLAVMFTGAMVWYVLDAKTAQRSYEVTIDNQDQSVVLNSEQIAYERLKQTANETLVEPNGEPPVRVVNVSGRVGAAAAVALRLEQAGYNVTELSSDPSRVERRTVVVFDPVAQAAAVKVSGFLGGALLSAHPADTTDQTTVIFVGSDQIVQ